MQNLVCLFAHKKWNLAHFWFVVEFFLQRRSRNPDASFLAASATFCMFASSFSSSGTVSQLTSVDMKIVSNFPSKSCCSWLWITEHGFFLPDHGAWFPLSVVLRPTSPLDGAFLRAAWGPSSWSSQPAGRGVRTSSNSCAKRTLLNRCRGKNRFDRFMLEGCSVLHFLPSVEAACTCSR